MRRSDSGEVDNAAEGLEVKVVDFLDVRIGDDHVGEELGESSREID